MRICPKCGTGTEKWTACGCDTCDNPQCDYRWFCRPPEPSWLGQSLFLPNIKNIYLGLGIQQEFEEGLGI